MGKFQLVNPYIEGELETSFNGKTPLDAAEKTWNKLSGYFTGNLPKFAFTLKKDSKLHHFLVKENVLDGSVDYAIEKLDVKVPKKIVNKFTSTIDDFENKQKGGKRKRKSKKRSKKDDSSDSDSDSDFYSNILNHKYGSLSSPIAYWWYAPGLYEAVLDSVFVPSFTVPLQPYVHYAFLNSPIFGWD
jgi:hypothetical protein